MKILLVEDDQATGSVLAETLTAQQYSVSLATDGQTGLELAKAFEFDVILLDIVIPKLDGISLCKQLRAEGDRSPILLLTAKDSRQDLVLGLDAGADDYVVKPFDTEELLARIRALLRRGKAAAGTTTLEWENLRFDTIDSEVTCDGERIHLTPKEYCLLELFLCNPKRIFSRRAILDRLWDFAESPGEETISTHIKCVRQKLRAAKAGDPIETVHGLGYRLRMPTVTTASVVVEPIAPKPEVVKEPVVSTDELERRIQESTLKIWAKHQDKTIEQLEILKETAKALETQMLSIELHDRAKQEAHRLAGSLGIFGMMNGSKIAKELELLLQKKTLNKTHFKKFSTHLAALEVEVSQSLASIARSTESSTGLVTHESTGEAIAESQMIKRSHQATILIVDDDVLMAEHVRQESASQGLRVEVATEIAIARRMIQQSPPDVILLDLTFPSPTEDGFTLLQELTQRVPRIPTIAFTGRESLHDRLAVAQLGGCAFLQKPVSIPQIVTTVMTVLEQQRQVHRSESHYRILAVDDDVSVLSNLSATLSAVGIEVVTLNQPQHFWKVLMECSPDLLILDVKMPKVNGFELCQVVRQDAQWHLLPIVFFSTQTDEETIDKAFMVGADDYLGKSIDSAELTARIVRRLKRIGAKGMSEDLSLKELQSNDRAEQTIVASDR